MRQPTIALAPISLSRRRWRTHPVDEIRLAALLVSLTVYSRGWLMAFPMGGSEGVPVSEGICADHHSVRRGAANTDFEDLPKIG